MTTLTIGFDLDLTLADLRAGTRIALDEVNRRCPDPVDVDAVLSDLGAPFRGELRRYVREENLAETLAVFYTAFTRDGISHVTQMPGAAAALASIESSGDRAVVVTGRLDTTASRCLAAAGLPPLLASGSVFGLDKAPALRGHGACVYVGDHVLDVAAAHAAGLPAVGVATGCYSRAQLAAAGAEVVLGGLDEFGEWFAAAATRDMLTRVGDGEPQHA